jgi:hypothetical protein
MVDPGPHLPSVLMKVLPWTTAFPKCRHQRCSVERAREAVSGTGAVARDAATLAVTLALARLRSTFVILVDLAWSSDHRPRRPLWIGRGPLHLVAILPPCPPPYLAVIDTTRISTSSLRRLSSRRSIAPPIPSQVLAFLRQPEERERYKSGTV